MSILLLIIVASLIALGGIVSAWEMAEDPPAPKHYNTPETKGDWVIDARQPQVSIDMILCMAQAYADTIYATSTDQLEARITEIAKTT